MNFNDTNFLNGVRWFLALWVALGHFYQHIGGPDFLKFPLWYVLMYPGPAVDGFIVITGFLMTYHYILRQEHDPPQIKSTWHRFYIKRFFRLYPIYFIIILIAYFTFPFVNQQAINMHHYFHGADLVSFTYGENKRAGLTDLFTHLTFVHGLLPKLNATIIGPAWSLSTEVQFYVLFPFIFLIFKSSKRLFLLILLSSLAYVITIKLGGVWETPGKLGTFGAPALLSHKMIYFCLGILMAKYMLNKCSAYPVLLNLLFIAFFTVTYISTIICFALYIIMFSEKDKEYIPNSLLWAIRKAKGVLSWKIMELGANISYSFYMVHSMLIPISFFITKSYFETNIAETVYISLVIFLISTIIFSWILYTLIEKPFIDKGKKVLKNLYAVIK